MNEPNKKCNRFSITFFHPTQTYINSLLVSEAFSGQKILLNKQSMIDSPVRAQIVMLKKLKKE